jgi:hypothetical protein
MPDNLPQSDHDLLIRIDERVRASEDTAQRHASEHRKLLTAIETKLESKAEKVDIAEVRIAVQNHEARLVVLETGDVKDKAEKETVIKLGLGGIKVWQLVMGSILFLITVGSVLASLIDAFKQ